MLEINTEAPEFSLKDQNGKLHTLSDYLGNKVLLYFYSKDNTPG
ncbi:redoxin domain-containing protein [Succinivibrio sp. AGMB01872]|uniref:Redoxin domain-containing protein n=2 Tax=Succinivibrio faecicola TaxID=2820300 RepID=A0ABS7DIN4_9GAMM|nr:redoxin domain-containing protein [Succinivibrio faecicola]